MATSNHSWLDWAVELQSLAQAGLYYCHNYFDRERYTRIREISAEMLAAHTDASPEEIMQLFCSETGYQTPKLDTRCAIIQGEKILLVHESRGGWAMPGGWCEVNKSPAANAVKEAKEEAGLDIRVDKIIAVQDRDLHNHPLYANKVCVLFYLCTPLGGEFVPNVETTESRWFGESELPDLSEERNTEEQIAMCFAAARDPEWQTRFD